MELDIWKGEWGLPSIDRNCLQIMSYAKFAGAPIKLKVTNNPIRTPNGSLPVFRHNNLRLDKLDDMILHIRQQSHSADCELTTRQCSEVAAYCQLIKEKIVPALEFVWWIDAKNYIEFTRPLYAKLLPFPLNFYYPGQYEKHAKNLMEALFQEDDNNVIETAVYRQAEQCITMLATKLGDKEFFMGSSPCALDAAVFAHLAPLLKAPLPSSALQNHLKACNNLSRFIGRILQRYFSNDVQNSREQQPRIHRKSETHDVDPDFPNKKRNYMLAAAVATAAMAGYALSTGIIQILPSNDDYEFDVKEDNER